MPDSTRGHTEGEWIVNTARTVAGANGDIAVTNPHGTLLAVAYLRKTPEETLANARLIAAAPDLATALRAEREKVQVLRGALEGLVKINVDHDKSIAEIIGRQPGWNDSYLDRARAALAQTEGEE